MRTLRYTKKDHVKAQGEKKAIHEPRKMFSEEINSLNTIWDFKTAECKKKKFCYFSHPSLWYFVIAALENEYNFHINTFENLQ